MRRFYLMSVLTVLLLSACTGTQKPAPFFAHGLKGGAINNAGVHTVSGNDTIWNVSKRYRIAMPALIEANHLQPPFALKSGQRLKLPPPQIYKVRAGDSLTEIARMFNTRSHDIASLNNLQAPYAVKNGQVLRMPFSVGRQPAPVQMASVSVPPYIPPTNPVAVPSVQREVLGGSIESETLPPPVQIASTIPPQPSAILNPIPTLPPPNLPPQSGGRTSEELPKKSTAMLPRSSSKFLMPVSGQVVSSYGGKANGLHNDGVNIKAARGTTVKAAENGVVVYADNGLGGYGNLVLIRHADRWMTAYAHLDQIAVRKGQQIKRGQKLGTVGSTGNVASPQLHFEVRRGTEALNPVGMIERQGV